MKILKKKERVYDSFSEKYDLSGIYAGKQGVPAGVLLLYILVKRQDLDCVKLTAEARGEAGEERNILHADKDEMEKLFASPEALAEVFERQELVIWELETFWHKTEAVFSGRTYATVISILTPASSALNFMPLMYSTEQLTFEYHDFDRSVVEQIRKRYHMDQKETILTLTEMDRETDIRDEFLAGLKQDPFQFPAQDAVSAEGFTAGYLHETYPLSEIGAYNYLIYLRQNPKEALSNLRKGLPR